MLIYREPINRIFVADNLSHYSSSNLLFSTKVPCSVASVALLCNLSQFYTNLKNLLFAMNEKNGSGESKPKQSQRQGEFAPELSVGRAYAVEPLAVGKV